MLGPTDPSHIIRCIEYWDIEQRRFPAYKHIAVLVAEEVTARFLNVMSLLAGTIPLIAIQLDALQVEDKIVLNFVHVLNQTELRRDDESETDGEVTDRSFWEAKVGAEILSVCDRVLTMINEKSKTPHQLNYRRPHIGLKPGGTPRQNFVGFKPKKKFIHITASVSNPDQWVQRIEDAGLPANEPRPGRVKVTITPQEFRKYEDLIKSLVHQSAEEFDN